MRIERTGNYRVAWTRTPSQAPSRDFRRHLYDSWFGSRMGWQPAQWKNPEMVPIPASIRTDSH
jgi:hypothetical protein